MFIHEKGMADQFDEIIYDMAHGGEQRKWLSNSTIWMRYDVE